MKQSGAEGLSIGVETGSDKVRHHMRKHFKTEDINAELEYFSQKQIVCVLLFFSCYPTEQWEDFVDTIDMLINYQKYCANGTIYKLTLGTPYVHVKGTALWENAHNLGLEVNYGNEVLWRLNENKNLTFFERIRRRLILQEVGFALGLPLTRTSAELMHLRSTIELHLNDIDNFFGEEKVKTYTNLYGILDYDTLLMPPEIQKKVKEHLDQNSENSSRIKEIHKYISNDDINFESQMYYEVKKMII